MALWLMKQEPDDYSFADLERDGTTTWDGVSNPLALKHLRSCAVGDLVFFYHTGKEKAVVGVMEVVGTVPTADGKNVTVTVQAVRRLPNPVTLATIKADAAFANWELVKQARLSVMPVTKAMWDRVEKHAAGKV
ncbi:MAG: EVE domain-containing protein [Fimbriiglobus sp.]|jgi:predicted RNA-binding protein with PUA-like domain|nr:EVE domain-containing protein [Fimbriiglobus sp.]